MKKFNLKNIIFSVGIAVFSLALFSGVLVSRAEATTCTAIVDGGNWSTPATWSGDGCDGLTEIPEADDDVVIPLATAGVNSITVDTDAVANSLTIDNTGLAPPAPPPAPPPALPPGVTISGSYSLTVTNAVTLSAPSGDGNTTLNVGAGALSAGSIGIIGVDATKLSIVRVSTGTITVTGNITFTTTSAFLQSAGDSTINIGGNLGSDGTLRTDNTGTINFNGTGAQVMGTYTTYNNVVIAGTGNTVSPVAGATTTIGGNLTVTTGTLALGTNVFSVTGTTSVASGGTLTMSTGTKTFNGAVTLSSSVTLSAATININGALNVNAGTLDVADSVLNITGAITINNGGTLDVAESDFHANSTTTVNTGGTILFSSPTNTKYFNGDVEINGTWNEEVAAVISFFGNLTNNATTWTASTGSHTFNTSGKIISGSTTTVFYYLMISEDTTNSNNLTVETLFFIQNGKTLTNNGTVTATTSLEGAGTFTNGATGILNIGGTSGITTLTATEGGNTVNYTKTGDQAVKIAAVFPAVSYYNLGFSGSGGRVIVSGIAIANNLTIASGPIAKFTGSSTANALYLNGAKQVAGTWGATGSGADHINDTYFSITAAGLVDVTTGPPIGASAVITNSTSTTVDIVVTGTDFDTFVNSGTTTANATDRAGIDYKAMNPTSAIINNSTTITLTFAIVMGTGIYGGSLTIAADIVQDTESYNNTLITIVNGSITDTAKPVIRDVTLSNTGTRNRITFTYSEPVTVSDGASTSSSGDIITAGTIAGFGSFATAGDVVIGTTKNTIAGSGTTIITLDLADQTGGFMTTGSTTEPAGVFTPVAGSAVVDISTNQVLTTATPTASGAGSWDLTKPTITSITVSDAVGSNSKIDRAVLVFNSAIRDSNITDADASLGATGTTTGSFTTGTANDDTTTFNRTSDDNAVNTTITAGDFTYSGSTTKITDLAGNLLNTATDGTIVTADVTEIDGVAPTVTVTMSDYALTVGETATITFTFTEAPTGFASADVTVANGTIGAINSTNPLIQTATYTPTASISDSTNIITVGTGWTDSVDNTGVGDDSPNYTIDTIAPSTSGSSIHYGCKDPKATNYEYFSSSKPSLCKYAEVILAPIVSTTLVVEKTPLFTRNLKYRTRGDDVKTLQTYLNTLIKTDLVLDGIFGPKTKAAVLKFQKTNNLQQDGIVGPKTNAKLNKLLFL